MGITDIIDEVKKHINLENPDCTNYCDLDGNKKKVGKTNKQAKNCKKTTNNGQKTCDRIDCTKKENEKKKECIKFYCCNKRNRDDTKCKMPSGNVVIDINCRSYPVQELPPPKINCAIGYSEWEVRTEKRNVDTTKQKLAKFRIRLESYPLSQKEKERLIKTLSIKNLSIHPDSNGATDDFVIPKGLSGKQLAKLAYKRIKLINKSIYKGKGSSDKLNIHHLQPVWAGGKDKALNYWVAPAGHQKTRGAKTMASLKTGAIRKDSPNIHDWWQYKIWIAAKKALKATHRNFLKCNLPKPVVNEGVYTENNITEMAKKLSLATPPIKVIIKIKCSIYCDSQKVNPAIRMGDPSRHRPNPYK